MAEQKKQLSADEKLHQQVSDTDSLKVVYDNETDSQREQTKASKQQDEGLADTFPASDAPAPSNPTTAAPTDNKSK